MVILVMYAPYVSEQLQLLSAQLCVQTCRAKMPVPRHQDNRLVGFYHITLAVNPQLFCMQNQVAVPGLPLQFDRRFEHHVPLICGNPTPLCARPPVLLLDIGELQARFEQSRPIFVRPLLQPPGLQLALWQAMLVEHLPAGLLDVKIRKQGAAVALIARLSHRQEQPQAGEAGEQRSGEKPALHPAHR
jgi:hypothetical protein